MNSNEIRLQARAFVKEFDLHDLDYNSLKSVIEKQGFTVVEFNHLYNNQDVELLIQTLSLTTAINRSRGFTYVDKHHRIVFINENLSDEGELKFSTGKLVVALDPPTEKIAAMVECLNTQLSQIAPLATMADLGFEAY